MSRRTSSIALLAALSGIFLVTGAAAQTRLTADKLHSIAAQLPAAAEKAGIRIQPESTTVIMNERISVATALVAGPAPLNRAAVQKGAVLSFVYVSPTSEKLPSGYYTLNVSQGRGGSWKVSLVNLDKKEFASAPADIRIAEEGGGSPAAIVIYIDGVRWGTFGSEEFMLRMLRHLI